MSDRAATVIPLPLSVVESNIWDVTTWATFVGDVEWVERIAHERYLFGVRQGRRVHDIPGAVRWHARDHRVTWRELEGPAWRGELRLTAVNGRRTRVTMEVTSHPRTFVGNLADMLGGRHRDVGLDLHRLAERLAHIPQPLNPARLSPARPLGAGGLRAARSADYRPGTVRAAAGQAAPGRPSAETESVGAFG